MTITHLFKPIDMIHLKLAIDTLGCQAENYMWAIIDYRLKTKDKSSNLKEIETRLDDIIYSVKRAKMCIDSYIEECPEVNKTKFTDLIVNKLKNNELWQAEE